MWVNGGAVTDSSTGTSWGLILVQCLLSGRYYANHVTWNTCLIPTAFLLERFDYQNHFAEENI